MAHYEPPHQDLRCLNSAIFISSAYRIKMDKSTFKFYNHFDKGEQLKCLPNKLFKNKEKDSAFGMERTCGHKSYFLRVDPTEKKG